MSVHEYLDSQIIKVEGDTEDHEVYAALEDLRIWCEAQLRGCNDLLARPKDPRHQLDLYGFRWRITPINFEPVLVRFEFDRSRMFDILGDEIYQGDPYVFLRELLQNSIDAIRMRREVLKQEGLDLGNQDAIYVNVEHHDDGDAIITWADNGIGMDEEVVKNYLAIAGQSYYHSRDFEKTGIKMDPISRFGVGILSCFMIADYIEIETRIDPHFSPEPSPLKIEIPAMDRNFRIEKLAPGATKIGTTVRVHVKGKRLPIDKETDAVKPLEVTEYLSTVAGFVEFPIVVHEGDIRKVIVHPKQDPDSVKRRFGQKYEIQQIDLQYPWKDAIFAQDLHAARDYLTEDCYDVASDLGVKGYEGVMSYISPIGRDFDMSSRPTNEAEIMTIGGPTTEPGRVRWSDNWSDYRFSRLTGLTRSSMRAGTYSVYRDGILVSTAESPSSPSGEDQRYTRVLPLPRLVVNLSKSETPKVDLARSQILDQKEHWATPVFQAHLKTLVAANLSRLIALDPLERWYEIWRMIVYDNLDPNMFWRDFPQEHWPILFIGPGGGLNAKDFGEITDDFIAGTPQFLEEWLSEVAKSRWITKDEYKGPFTDWIGEPFLFELKYRGPSEPIREGGLSWSLPFHNPVVSTIRFLDPPWHGDPPLVQPIYSVTKGGNEVPFEEEILERIIDQPEKSDSISLNVLVRQMNNYGLFPPRMCRFQPPFEEAFGYSVIFLNICHPVVQKLARIASAFCLSKVRKLHADAQLGIMQDAFTSFFGFRYEFRKTDAALEAFALIMHRICNASQIFKLQGGGEVPAFTVDLAEFVPGTFGRADWQFESILEIAVKGKRFGGQLN